MHVAQLGGLFLSAFVAATLIPIQSESILAALVLSGQYALVLLVAIASVGNVGGSVVNWWLGTKLTQFQGKKWFPFSQKQLDRGTNWFQKYGKWSLLLSWAPIIGDPITLIAGVLKVPFPLFVLLVTLAKTARYIFVVAVTMQFV